MIVVNNPMSSKALFLRVWHHWLPLNYHDYTIYVHMSCGQKQPSPSPGRDLDQEIVLFSDKVGPKTLIGLNGSSEMGLAPRSGIING